MTSLRLTPAWTVALSLLLVACGAAGRVDDGLTGTNSGTDGGSNDGGNGADAGGSDAGNETDGGSISATHESYIPAAERPTSAARLIVMGDSISAGYGTSTAARSYFNLLLANDSKWPNETNTTLPALFNADVPLVNVAVAGATTSSMLGQRSTLTSQLGATVSGHSIVVITIGGNDMKNFIVNMDASQINAAVNSAISNLRQIMTYLQDSTRFPDGTSIYLAAVYDPSDSSGTLPASCFGFAATNHELITGLENLHTRYVALGTELGFAVVDAMGHFHGHGISASNMSDPYYDASNPVTWFSSDCIHPNDAGHNELRRLFFEAIDVGHYTATDF
jgi:lysophospholipase L1-like esterase